MQAYGTWKYSQTYTSILGAEWSDPNLSRLSPHPHWITDHWERIVFRSHNPSGCFEKQKTCLLLPVFEPRYLGRETRNLNTSVFHLRVKQTPFTTRALVVTRYSTSTLTKQRRNCVSTFLSSGKLSFSKSTKRTSWTLKRLNTRE
jgi:hypothetical protein